MPELVNAARQPCSLLREGGVLLRDPLCQGKRTVRIIDVLIDGKFAVVLLILGLVFIVLLSLALARRGGFLALLLFFNGLQKLLLRIVVLLPPLLKVFLLGLPCLLDNIHFLFLHCELSVDLLDQVEDSHLRRRFGGAHRPTAAWGEHRCGRRTCR